MRFVIQLNNDHTLFWNNQYKGHTCIKSATYFPTAFEAQAVIDEIKAEVHDENKGSLNWTVVSI